MKNDLQNFSLKPFLYTAVFLILSTQLNAIPWQTSGQKQVQNTSLRSAQNDYSGTQSWDEIKTMFAFETSLLFNANYLQLNDGGEACFANDFSDITEGNNVDTNASGSAWSGNDDFPTVTRAYRAGGAVKLGTGSLSGSIESKVLEEVSGDVTVNIDVKGWTNVEGNLLVTLGGQEQVLSYTAVRTGDFETVSTTFSDITAGSTLKIETSAKRAYIDNVEVICESGSETEPAENQCYTLNKSIVSNALGTSFKWDTGEASDNSLPGHHFNASRFIGNLAFYFGNGGKGVSSNESAGNWLVLAPGDVVGPDSTFSAGFSTASNWIAGVDGYLGISFPCDAGTCYGYVHMTTTGSSGYPATVVDYCYDPTGAEVVIPGGEEPEPVLEGCLIAENDAFPSTVVTPSCIGVPESLTFGDLGYFGEFSPVNVTEGTEYIFTAVAEDTNITPFITIGDETGTTVLASGTASVTWTATATGVVRFYTHENDECLASSNWVNRMVQCGDPLPTPENDECEDAIAVSCGDTVTGSTLAANDSGSNASNDVFFTFTGEGTEELVTLSLCGSDYDTYLAVYSDCSLTTLVASNDDSDNCSENQSELSFVSDGTSTYVIVVEGYSGLFGNDAGNFELTVSCGDVPPMPEEPDFPCFFGDGLTSSFDDAFNIEMSNDFRGADDFIVEAGTQFTMQHITIDVNQQEVPDNVVINIREDNAGSPGAIIETINTVPTSASPYAEVFGDPIYHLTFDLDTPIVLTEGTYWLETKMSTPSLETVWWLATSTGSHGSIAYQSTNDGATWTPNDNGLSLVFFVAGECETLGISDLTSFDFAYYPNPVKDVLNITSKKDVENVSVFNLAGQKVISNAKASNGQINVSSLAAGTYVFRVTLEGGQIETFKVIKK